MAKIELEIERSRTTQQRTAEEIKSLLRQAWWVPLTGLAKAEMAKAHRQRIKSRLKPRAFDRALFANMVFTPTVELRRKTPHCRDSCPCVNIDVRLTA